MPSPLFSPRRLRGPDGGRPGAPQARAPRQPRHRRGLIGVGQNPIVYFRTTSIFGRYTAQNNASQTIGLQRDRWPFDGNYVNAGTDTTDAQGDYSFTARPPVNAATARGRGNLFSVPVTVGVRIRVSRGVQRPTPEDRSAGPLPRPGLPAARRGTGQDPASLTAAPVAGGRSAGPPCATTTRGATSATARATGEPSGSSATGPSLVVISPHGDHRNGISRKIRLDVHS